MQVNTSYGGRMIYWNEPDGHQWEMLTASYSRLPAADCTMRVYLDA